MIRKMQDMIKLNIYCFPNHEFKIGNETFIFFYKVVFVKKLLTLEVLFWGDIFTDHLYVYSIIGKLSNDLDILLSSFGGFLVCDHRVTFNGDSGGALSSIGCGFIKSFSYLKVDFNGLQGSLGQDLPFASRLSDFHGGGWRSCSLSHQHAETQLGEEFIVFFLLGSEKCSCFFICLNRLKCVHYHIKFYILLLLNCFHANKHISKPYYLSFAPWWCFIVRENYYTLRSQLDNCELFLD